MYRIAVLHTTPVTLDSIKRLIDDFLPEVEVMNILDDSLLVDVMKNNGLNEEIDFRINSYIKCAEKAKCDILMSACSSIGESIEKNKPLTSMTLLRIDEPMVELAVNMGNTIGVVATVRTTLEPTINLVNKKAKEKGKEVRIISNLVNNAYNELIQGNSNKHDKLVKDSVIELSKGCNVIILAQASMAGAVSDISDNLVPILNSPTLGIEKLREMVALKS